MPNLYEWFLILFQPMSQEKLNDMLISLDLPTGSMTMGLYGLFGFLVMLVIRQIAVIYRYSRRYGEIGGIVLLLTGALSGGAASLLHLAEMRAVFAAAPAADFYQFGSASIPGFELFHRAIMPLDVRDVDLFLQDGGFLYELKRGLLAWPEGARGLFVYPVLFVMLLTPVLRRLTGPFAVGVIGASIIPSLLVGFATSGPVALAVLLGFFLFASGGAGGILRRLRGRE